MFKKIFPFLLLAVSMVACLPEEPVIKLPTREPTDTIATQARFTSFSILQSDNENLTEDIIFSISEEEVRGMVADTIDVSSCIVTFEHTGSKVMLEGLEVKSGRSAIDFSGEKVVFTLVDSLGLTREEVNVFLDRVAFVNKPSLATLYIETYNGLPIISKDPADYLDATFTIDGNNYYPNYEGTGRIRGRGNSTWLWYDKKPYRIKLDEKASILGLAPEKDWVLLANFRDPTMLMNFIGFRMGELLGIAYPNHSRYMEVYLNGEYIGLYELTEQVEQGTNRVNVADEGGLLLTLDVDDGPYGENPEELSFNSEYFRLPMAVKYPDTISMAEVNVIKKDFAVIEELVDKHIWDNVDPVLDLESFVAFLVHQELIYNVELNAPRSIFMHKEPGGKYTFGPVWDMDAGFDFDWAEMTTGHTYFLAQDIINPGPYGSGSNGFFYRMYRNQTFVDAYKAKFNSIYETLLPTIFSEMDAQIAVMEDAIDRNYERWPITNMYEYRNGRRNDIPYNYYEQVDNLKNWLTDRMEVLNDYINDMTTESGGGGSWW